MRIVQPLRTGLSFDDVLLTPQRTSLTSRRQADTSVELLDGIRLRVPIISANTQWCTGDRMAVAMARGGGLGILHRMQTPEQQIAQLDAVKAVRPGADEDRASLAADGSPLVGAAVGVTGDWRERAAELVGHGVDILLVDVAHGHSDQVIDAVKELRSDYPQVPLIAGNVATAAGVRDLAEAGAGAVKVGIGPGGVCTTRLVAGTGVPQLTAVLDCAEAAAELGVRIIADGGIRQSGDIAKSLAAGAHAVMLGSALAGADESEAEPVTRDGRAYKVSRGFASLGMELTLRMAAGGKVTQEEIDDYVPEGVEVTFAASGPLTRTLRQLVGGVQSAMSYSGAADLDAFRNNAEFVRVTSAGRAENVPHARERSEQITAARVAGAAQ
ncbi:guanosine monophosphate reductase [Streptomyces sulfonofaciens]|uniref:Guanosine monophosphate reductase n=1 Tax=Streptomyces sulfonofaciens TaxID=68272 RepID=A0A919G3M8_9ACTN|nr:IMP dehydrogenase [Streptomyces sulfonofaciens]GHH76906.1 guanosine monophosphate reductase [Streptomyces sulfonofaciens]